MAGQKTAANYPPEVRERPVRPVLDGVGEHGAPWAAIGSIVAKIGCTAETLSPAGRAGARHDRRSDQGGARPRQPAPRVTLNGAGSAKRRTTFSTSRAVALA